MDEDRTRRPAPRRRRPWARTGALLALAGLLVACSSDETVTPRAPASESGAAVSTDLTITSDDGEGAVQTWRLTCDPAGGDHPDPAAACGVLAARGEAALPPVPKDAICTQIYGGPQTATVRGSWRGEPVDATFTRRNGCEISRWDQLAGLLPTTGGEPAR